MVLGVLTFYANRNFYEKPDGEALVEKLLCSSEIPVKAAVMLTAADTLLPNKEVFSLYTVRRLFQRFLPMQCMALMFTVTTHIAAKIRKEDDSYNHALGALSTLPLVRIYLPMQTTIVAGCALVSLAVMTKSVMNDKNLPHHIGPIVRSDRVAHMPAWSELKELDFQYIKYD